MPAFILTQIRLWSQREAALACIGGLLWSASNKLASPTAIIDAGPDMQVISAAILGGISFGGGVGGMGGAFLGLLILNTFQVGMGIVGVNPFWVNVFSGLLLLIALAFDFLSQQRQKKSLAH